jgi:hypothetical protein
MKSGRICAFLAVATLAGGPLLAEDKPAAPPKPAAEMSQLAYFNGNWGCTGKAFASPFGPEHATEAKVMARPAMGGFWYGMHYDETKTAANPAPYHAMMIMGFDPGQKMFVSNCFDSMGGGCSQTSAGWKGDVLAFEGTSVFMGKKGGARDTFTKISATEVKHAAEMQGPDGKWIQTDEETCTKAAKK